MNNYWPQALRHLWALAVDARSLHAVDVDSQAPVIVPVRIRLWPVAGDTEGRCMHAVTPCLLPELHLVESVTVCGPRYETHTLRISSGGSSSENRAGTAPDTFVDVSAGADGTPTKPGGPRSSLTGSSLPARSTAEHVSRTLHPLTLFVQRRPGELPYETDPAGHARLRAAAVSTLQPLEHVTVALSAAAMSAVQQASAKSDAIGAAAEAVALEF